MYYYGWLASDMKNGVPMKYRHDLKADAVYVYLRKGAEVAHSVVVDEGRVIDYGSDGKAVGIEILGVSAGVQLSDLIDRFGLHDYTMSLLKLEERMLDRWAARPI